VRESPENRMQDGEGPYFDEPIVGYAAAGDPLFTDYKSIIGPFHQTPQEVLERAMGPGEGAATVICWSLPIVRETRDSNRRQGQWPSREWAMSRTHGEIFNNGLRRHLVAHLEGLGHRGVAPQLAPAWRWVEDSVVGITSNWSERHAAYAAGLGTFSLTDALITERGIAHRLGSVVTSLRLEPTPRSYTDHRHHCLFFRGEGCRACIDRCPVGAITSRGHDKDICRAYVYGVVPRAVGERYGVPHTGCGLCQTGVPCEAAVPQ
jgi:epoxyqueuosine reductase QueG